MKKIGNISHAAAVDKLERMLIFDMLKQLQENFCYRCKQSIDSYEEYSLDHTIPWRTGKTIEEKIKLLTDENLIKPSHRQCNTPDSQRFSGKTGYLGVTEFPYEYKGIIKPRYPARVTKNNKDIFFGYWKDAKTAAFSRDFGACQIYNGKIILNFEQFRNLYMNNIKMDFKDFVNEYKKVLG